MTVVDTLAPAMLPTTPSSPPQTAVHRRPAPAARGCTARNRSVQRRRPGGAPLRYRGTGVRMAQTSHRPRRITLATTVGLAVLAALITVWLGEVAQLGASAAGGATAVPDRLAVVRVQNGESLRQLAARVAPGAPADRVAERIRELNRLDSVTLDAGQTLIAPIG